MTQIKTIHPVYFYIFPFILLFTIGPLHSQLKTEREHRIKKKQFPESALALIKDKLEDARSIRFYKEVEADKTSYGAKFKKDRLRYGMVFDEESRLQSIGFTIEPIDIPDGVYTKIIGYLNDSFIKHRVLKIQQQYPLGETDQEETIKSAFQNLMLPYINYKFVVKGKKERGFEQYEFLFNSEGKFEMMRKALPANYDHVLY